MKKKDIISDNLESLEIFNELNKKEIKLITKYFSVQNISMGEPVILGDTIPNEILILIDGSVRLLVEHPVSKRTLSLNVEKPNYIIGLISNEFKRPEEYITAATDCNFLKVNLSNWNALISKYPSVLNSINEKINVAKIWPLIKNCDYLFPEIPNEFQKLVKDLSKHSLAKTFESPDEIKNNFDLSLNWFFASDSDVLNFCDKFTLNELELLNKKQFPIRLIGVPKLEEINQKKDYLIKSLDSNENKKILEKSTKKEIPPKLDEENLNKDPYSKYRFFQSSDDPVFEAIACFRMVAQVLDLPIKVDLIKRFFNENFKKEEKKLSFNLLAAFAETLGLKTQILELPVRLMTRVKTPAILQLNSKELCTLFEIKNDKFLIGRPQYGIKTFNSNELLQFSDNNSKISLLTLYKTPNTLKNKFSLKWFLPAIKKNRKPLIEVLIASLFVQLLQLANPLIIQQIIDKVLGQGGVKTLPVLAILLFTFSFFENVLTAVRTNLFIDTTNRIDITLGEQVIDHLLRLPLSFFDKRAVGELSSRLGELEQIRSFMTSTALTVVLDSVFSIIYIAVMLAYSWVLTIIALLVAPLLAIITISVSPIIRRQLRTKAELNARTQNHLVEVITGIQTVKAQNFELKARWKWRDRYTKYISESFKNAVTSTTYSSLTNFLNQFSGLATLCVGSFLVLRGSLTLGELIAFRIISSYVTEPLLRLSNLYQSFQQTNISIERLSDIINYPQEASEKDSENIPMPKISGSLEFKNVSFSFFDRGSLILSKINLKINEGQFVAIVGESGSGKSTLSKLIARLYEPIEGKILIDGIDISKVELNSLRRQIGVVPQDSILFDGSVQENISLTNPESSIEEVMKAAEIACANEFIMQLQTGYASAVGERGSNLSGGQRQRIAIARSVLQNPNLLIMDESTSALDYKTERKVSLNLMEYFRKKTVLFITHRLNSIIHADVIITMHQGKVEEIGTHSELMDLKGRYYSLYKQQRVEGL